MKDWSKTIIWGGILTAFIVVFLWDITYNNSGYTTRALEYVVTLVTNMATFMERWSHRLFGSYRYAA